MHRISRANKPLARYFRCHFHFLRGHFHYYSPCQAQFCSFCKSLQYFEILENLFSNLFCCMIEYSGAKSFIVLCQMGVNTSVWIQSALPVSFTAINFDWSKGYSDTYLFVLYLFISLFEKVKVLSFCICFQHFPLEKVKVF